MADDSLVPVNVFSSKKRHLLATLTEPMQTPPDTKSVNTLVLDAAAFTARLTEYATLQANATRDSAMFHGFDPTKVVQPTGSVDFITDIAELPNFSYGRENGIHGFPAMGTLVVKVPPATLTLLIAAASYLYNTDIYEAARRPDPFRSRPQRETTIEGLTRKSKSGAPMDVGVKNAGLTVSKAREAKVNLIAVIGELKTTFGFDIAAPETPPPLSACGRRRSARNRAPGYPV